MDQADDYSRVDFYLEQIIDCMISLPIWGCPTGVETASTRNRKWRGTAEGLSGDLITQLRSDANLRYLYAGPDEGGACLQSLNDLPSIEWRSAWAQCRKFFRSVSFRQAEPAPPSLTWTWRGRNLPLPLTDGAEKPGESTHRTGYFALCKWRLPCKPTCKTGRKAPAGARPGDRIRPSLQPPHPLPPSGSATATC